MNDDLHRLSREELEAEVRRLRAKLAEHADHGLNPSGQPQSSPSAYADVLFSAIDQTSLPMILTDPHQDDDPIVFTNRAFLNLTGYSADEIIGRNCRFLQGPDTEPDRVDEIRAALRDNRDLAIEITNHHSDGTPFINALFIGPVFDVEGQLRYRFGSQIDVTEAHHNRRRIAESEARQRAVFESASELAIIVTDTEGAVTDWNIGAERILGWSAEEMRGRTVERIFTPEDRATGRAREEMALVLQEGHAEDVRWHMRKDGGRFYAVGDMTSLRGLDGTHQGFVKAMSDRTEQQVATIQHQADAEFMRSVLAASADCIKVLDLDGGLTFMSEGGQKVMEVSDFNSIKGCPWPSFWQGKGNADAMEALATAKGGGVGHFQGPADTFLGNPKWWDVQVTPIFGTDGRPERILSVSRDITEQKSFGERLAASEAHWRSLFERLSEGFIVGEVVRDATGRITDWRYIDVNAAWGRLVGIDPDSVVGRTIREVFPGIEEEWVNEFVQVVESGEPVAFTRQVGNLRRWYDGRAFPLRAERFGVLFLEVTARVEADARRDALLELGDRLRELNDVPAIVQAAAEITAHITGATRAGYGVVDATRETVAISHDWCGPGQASVAGLHSFRAYGSYIEDLKRGEVVAVNEVTSDPRTRNNAEALLGIGVCSLLNVPIIERGRLVGIAFVHYVEAHTFTEGDLGFVRAVADRIQSAVARVHAEAEQRLVNEEISHRLKNSFAMVLSIAGQTLRTVSDRAPVEAFEKRIHALSSAHDVLLRKVWSSAPAKEVVKAVLANAGYVDRVAVSGPEIDLGPRATLSLSLLLHELATNAAKYGSLSVPDGRVSINWHLDGEGEDQEVSLDWAESGGPTVVPPINTGRKGFGSRLISVGLAGTGGVDLRYLPSGFEATMRAPLVQLQRS